jgi:ABC-type transport system substrate-binding protein
MSEKKVLRVGLLTDLGNLDPRRPPEFSSTFGQLQVYEPLFSLPTEGSPPQPLLLDGPLRPGTGPMGEMTYSARVKEGITFSDGHPVTAQEIAGCLAGRDAVTSQAGVEARGDELVFTLELPNARFHLTLCQAACSVFREVGGRVVGTGPFVVAEASDDEVRLVRNERFRESVPLDEVRLRVFPVDAEGRPERLLEAIEEGHVDLSPSLGREDVARLTAVRKYILTGSSTCFLYFNTERPALSSREARQALALALDRRALTRLCYTNALAFTAQSPLPPVLGEGRDGLDDDPVKARELLASLGDRRPQRLGMLTVWGPRPYLPQPGKVAAAVADALGELGMSVEVTATRDAADYFRRIAAGEADLFLSGWTADTPDPADFLDAVLSSRAVPRPGADTMHGNLSRFSDPGLDGDLERYRADPRDEHWEAILERLRREVPLLPLMHGAAIFVHSFRVRNFVPSPLGWASLGGVDVRD